MFEAVPRPTVSAARLVVRGAQTDLRLLKLRSRPMVETDFPPADVTWAPPTAISSCRHDGSRTATNSRDSSSKSLTALAACSNVVNNRHVMLDFESLGLHDVELLTAT